MADRGFKWQLQPAIVEHDSSRCGSLLQHRCRFGGTIWSWGSDSYGQLGNGMDSAYFTVPASIDGVGNIVSVTAGYSHTLALRADGTIWGFGDDGVGELGDNLVAYPNSDVPVQAQVDAQMAAIAAGAGHSVSLDFSGNVWAWGMNYDGQIGQPMDTFEADIPEQVGSIANVVAIAAGDLHTVALKADGTVWTWGNNNSGQLGRTSSGSDRTPTQVNNLNSVVSIAGGNQFTLAATSNGFAYAWGDNTYGQLGINPVSVPSTNRPMLVAGTSNVVAVVTGPNSHHSMALTFDHGTNNYVGWGNNDSQEIGNYSTNTFVAAPAGPLLLCDCIQLGTNGSFTAQCTGTLRLLFNDDYFPDNQGAYTATVYGISSVATQLIVVVSNERGTVAGIVSNGVTYTYTASGFVADGHGCSPTCEVDADGNDHSRQPYGCVASPCVYPCPHCKCYSLIGIITEQ